MFLKTCLDFMIFAVFLQGDYVFCPCLVNFDVFSPGIDIPQCLR
jgi:hypothetical protein